MQNSLSTATKFAARLRRWTTIRRLSIRLRPRWAAVLWSTLCNNRCNRECTFFSLPCAGTCAHTDSAVLTDAGARVTSSHKISPPSRGTRPAQCMPPTYCRAPRETLEGHRLYRRQKKKVSWVNCVTAEKVIPVSFFYAVVRQRPRIFRAYNRPRYVKMHKDDDNSAVRNREDFLFIRIIILSIFDLDRYNLFSPSNRKIEKKYFIMRVRSLSCLSYANNLNRDIWLMKEKTCFYHSKWSDNK